MTREPCPFCGEPYELDVHELYLEERTFLLRACCEEAERDASEWLASGEVPVQEVRDFFLDRTGLYVRRLIFGDDAGYHYGNGGITLDLGIEIREISLAEARDFVRKHHRHNAPPPGWRFGYGAWNGAELVGVAMAGRPVARMLPADEIVEVNRVCTRADLPAGIAWNACSMLYAACAREARRRGFLRIITYTLESEPARALRGMGWTPEHRTRGESWNRKSRPRQDTAPTCVKIRWARELSRRRAG